MAGISINFLADVKNFLRGTKNVEDELDDVADSLDDMAKDGDKAAEKIEKSFRDLAKETKQAGDDIGKDFKRGTREAEGGLVELKDEANQTARESAASFDGSAESIVDSFQEIAANAFAGFGPAGAVAGLAMAAGIGLAVKGFKDNEEAAEELKQKVADLTEQYIEAGRIGSVSLEDYIDAIKTLASETDDAKLSLTDIKDASGDNLQMMQDLAEAVGGLKGEYQALIDANNEQIDKLRVEQQEAKSIIGYDQERVQLLGDRIDKIREANQALEQQSAAEEDAAVAAQAANDIGLPALQARADMVEMVNAAYDDAAGNVTDFINKETGIFDVQAYIASMQEREKALQDYQTALASSGLTPEAKEFLNSQGAEAASLMLKGYSEGDAATKAELSRIWSEAGKEGSGAADKAIKETFKTPAEAKVNVKADTKPATEAIDAWINRTRYVDVIARIRDDDGRVYG